MNKYEDCYYCSGEDYRGQHSTTEGGFTCQRWDSQRPHRHRHVPASYPQHDLTENYCRNPRGDSRPWCYSTHRSRTWEYCSVPRCKAEPTPIDPEVDCITDRGKRYRGTISVTWSGKTCQRWSAQTPQYHENYTPEKMPCGDLRENYCRNPDNDTKPWCYTTDPNTFWEYCNVPICEDSEPNCTEQDVLNFLNLTSNNDRFTMGRPVKHHKFSVKVYLEMEIIAVLDVSCTITFKSQSYDDNELQIADRKKTNETENQFQTQDEWVLKNFTWNKGTAENITMQRWSALYIANFLFPVLFFLSLDLASFLISDTGGQKLGFKITVLLAVTVMQLLLNEILPGSSDKIPLIAIFCIGIFTLMLLSVLETILVMNLIDRDASSQEETEQNMKKKRVSAEDCLPCDDVYRGRRNTTRNGYTCQRWDSQEPHSHNYTPSAYPHHHLEENYCRNPDGRRLPWCYTTNSSEVLDYCLIPSCKSNSPTVRYDDHCTTGRGEGYRGTISVTWSGKTCRMWSAMGGFKDAYPCKGLDENYCRNPDNDTKPWCFTTDSSWAYCTVPNCEDDFEPNCTEQDLLNSLNLNNKDLLIMGRPVSHHKKPVKVHLKMEIYAVLDVSEIEQTVYLHIWTQTGWNNHHIKWNESEFCNLSRVNVPAQSLWKPDIIIAEQIERSKNSPSPYVTILSHGAVSWLNEEVVVANCKMRVYRFPFDIQSCDITFKSQSYDDDQLMIADVKDRNKNESEWTERSVLNESSVQTQHEWIFKKMTVRKGTTEHSRKQTLVFTITMQRWSALYIANFLMPLLFFLSLDLASFLISDTGGEKLGFKITVLLAVTVMQLLLNEILPGSSDKIPLIAIFCVGIFTLMLLSVLETILVMNLIDRDASSQEKETEQSMKKKRGTKLCCFSSSNYDDSAEGTPFVFSKLFRDQQTDESINLKMVLEELKEVLLNHRKDEEKEGYWTKTAKRIDKIFTMLYFPAVVLFLLTMFSLWSGND
ncbi:uncharacterized protein LOC106521943 [Austrofundulus limnaeus]|uniref:Uncharacterized protein LOC106521943 n=1 Tax=Austrofundulus limnaeus TaxID=52670 RepID=A0A2I4BR30_AUSLI|nr:PREDICTED: uncharacterized protein LOC106521943 [Austrofundulus limnaeus]